MKIGSIVIDDTTRAVSVGGYAEFVLINSSVTDAQMDALHQDQISEYVYA